MSRVFILEPVNKDLSRAEEYGEIVYVFGEHALRPSIWETGDYLLAVQRRLEELDFNANDYFAAVGPTVPLLTVTTLLANLCAEFRMLFWHAQVQEYVSRTFSSKDYIDASVK